ncbi:outer membrane protein [Bartonella gliris]|uniref:outer membrane protein n=1 Tax=Bartonella gliris TaxID=3004109 RepID=UPI00295F3145|nr:outer membrane protein [Bartonella gliris]
MNTKCLLTASFFSFVLTSMTQAADVVISQQPKQVVVPIVVPAFSWTGFYIGGQIGGFSGKLSAMTHDVGIPFHLDEDSKNKEWVPIEKGYLPELSGLVGGFYAGTNVDLGSGFILGVDTDMLLGVDTDMLFSGRKKAKTIIKTDEASEDAVVVEKKIGKQETQLRAVSGEDEGSKAEEDRITFSHILKQKWTGATRVRVGFSSDRFMPYISGGVAYGKFQDIMSASIAGEEELGVTFDVTKMMVGYTLGGGIDYAMTDNAIVRAEYRYSDFGKKKFGDQIELDYKTNDFRVGLAYKF